MNSDKSREKDPGQKVGLPPRIFLYTLDQISGMLSIPIHVLRKRTVYFQGRSTGRADASKIRARNIAAPDEIPDWRVTEHELIRWMKARGFTFRTDRHLIN